MENAALSQDQLSAVARALPLREGFDLLDIQFTSDSKLAIVGVNDPTGPIQFAPGGVSQLAKGRQQSFIASIDLESNQVRFRELDGVLRRFQLVGDHRVVCEVGYPFQQWNVLWDPRSGKLVSKYFGGGDDNNQVIVDIDPARQLAIVGYFYRKEYNDTDPYMFLGVFSTQDGAPHGEPLNEGAAYLEQRGKAGRGFKEIYGDEGPEIMGARFVSDGILVEIARRDRCAHQRDLWSLDLGSLIREEPSLSPAPRKVVGAKRTGTRLGRGLATGRWTTSKNKVSVSHKLKARKGESSKALEIRASIAKTAGVSLLLQTHEQAADLAREYLAENSHRLRYVSISDGASWSRALKTTERFDRALADELLRLVATRTHYVSGYGTVTFRSGLREATVSARSLTICGNQVTITEPVSALDEPDAFIEHVREIVGDRDIAAGAAGYFLSGLPLLDRSCQEPTRRIAKRFPGVDRLGTLNLLNWLILLPPRSVGSDVQRYVERLETMLPHDVIEEKLPGLAPQLATVRATDATLPYREALDRLPQGMTLHELPSGLLVRTSERAITANRAHRREQLTALKEAWQWLETLPFYRVSSGAFGMWIAAENVRDWFYTPEESAEENARWEKDQQAYFAQMNEGAQAGLSPEEFDEEFDD